MADQQTGLPASRYVLGLDLGVSSIGWACVALGPDGPARFRGLLSSGEAASRKPSLGVRIFDAGVENLGQGEREETRNVARRTARLMRRQTERRARRMSKLFRLLQQAGLLPRQSAATSPPSATRAEARDDLLKALDLTLVAELLPLVAPQNRGRLQQHLPYVLRARALDAPLTAHQLGRALYHLAQRRGFRSNRRADRDGRRGEDQGAVKKAISALAAEMAAPNPATGKPRARTLGEFLSTFEPGEARLRGRWTARAMYEQEFDSIWSAQAPLHPGLLTEDLRRRLRHAIFHQRPLKSQRHLVGECDIEDGSTYRLPSGELLRTGRRRRAPACLPDAQRFRLLQTVNDLRVVRTPWDAGRTLSAEGRAALMEALETAESLTVARARKCAGLGQGETFSIERGGEKRLLGNATSARFREVLGGEWDRLAADQRDAMVLEAWALDDAAALQRRIEQRRGPWAALAPVADREFGAVQARTLAEIRLSDAHVALSRRALRRLLPGMEKGLSYAEARSQAYGERVSRAARGTLPTVRDALGDIRNPVVERVLSELRRVVNGIIRMHGLPERIHVELARDVKQGRRERHLTVRANREREAERVAAAKRIAENSLGGEPTRTDVLKLLLWQECGQVCPYTGRTIAFEQLFGHDIDVEHIIPFSRSVDDSFLNKTLCFADFNRARKRNGTPWECLKSDPAAWEAACSRMRSAVERNGMSPAKLKRFLLEGAALEEFLGDFRARQLNETRYASRLSVRYLMMLYGGDLSAGVDAEGRRRIQVSNGQITALLRGALRLPEFLGGSEKTRDDHRHHAVDALAIALTDPEAVAAVSRAAEQAWVQRRRWFDQVGDPWPTFREDAREALGRLLVSHRVRNPVRGALHAETLYSPPRDAEGRRARGAPSKVGSHLRKPLSALTKGEVAQIVDDRVRALVEQALIAAGGAEPGKVFDDHRPESLPRLPTRAGGYVPIRRVRIRKANSTKQIGQGPRARHVEPSGNHHVEIIERETGGVKRIEARVVSRLEAAQRRTAGQPIVCREHGAGARLLMSIARRDVLWQPGAEGKPQYVSVLKFSQVGSRGLDLVACSLADARDSGTRSRERSNFRVSSVDRLLSDGYRKVIVDPCGVVQRVARG